MTGQSSVTNQAKWIELIRVRSSARALEAAMPGLVSQVREMDDALSEAETFLLKHALYEGDLAVGVVWRSGIEPGKTREGLMLAERLGELGSVDHAVWIPATD